MVLAWPVGPTAVVPTHGDWQPRNWLVDDGVVRAIDFGRAELRPAMTDLVRVAAVDFSGRPDLERAFVEGDGRDPRLVDPAAWHRAQVMEGRSVRPSGRTRSVTSPSRPRAAA